MQNGMGRKGQVHYYNNTNEDVRMQVLWSRLL